FAVDLLPHRTAAHYGERLDGFDPRPAAKWSKPSALEDLAGNGLIESLQLRLGFPLYGRANHRGHLVNLPGATLRLEERLAKLSQLRQVTRLERLNFEHALEKAILSIPGLVNA